MALSDEERRRLELLEQELASADPELARKLESGTPGDHGRWRAAATLRAVLALIAGLTLVIAGVATESIIIGATGFLLMITGAYWFFNGLHPQDRAEGPP